MEVKVTELKKFKSYEYIRGKNIKDYKPKTDIIGQKRAIEAIKTAFSIRKSGYHLFVVGLPGSGKTYAIKKFLEEIKPRVCPMLWDYTYVYNFNNPDSPLLIIFPKGQANQFKEYLYNFINALRKELPKVFESEVFTLQYQEILKKAQEAEKKILQPVQEELQKNGFALLMAKVGDIITPKILPIYENKPITFEKLEKYAIEGKITKEEFEKIKEKATEFEPHLNKILVELRDLGKNVDEELSQLEKTFANGIIDNFSQELKNKFSISKVHIYLSMLKEYLVKNLKKFLISKEYEDEIPPEYRVNIILDSSIREECPIYIEENPSWTKLFGTIEFDFTPAGGVRTDFTKIKCGSLLRADRGFLVINTTDLFEYPYVYQHLKRVLKYQRLEIAPPPTYFFHSFVLKPEPIDIDLKVILIGDEYHYNVLYNLDPEFKEIFRIKSHFNDRIEVSYRNVVDFMGAVAHICYKENLKNITEDGLEKLLFLSHRFSENNNYISLLFKNFYEILIEADFLAGQDNNSKITGKNIMDAYRNKIYRHSLYEEEVQKIIKEGLIRISFDGEKVGQVYGVSVINVGDHIFGHPSRITATVSIGKRGIANIEREVGMSGKIHSKAVLILESFIREYFAKNFPLSITAKICFEQLYSGVEGDSATVAETVALISAIAEKPVR
ncbi:MAG: AAA family ATPase, partial [Planctomycetota bacterium]